MVKVFCGIAVSTVLRASCFFWVEGFGGSVAKGSGFRVVVIG